MFSEELLRQLLATFADEAREQLAAISRQLLMLEQHPGPDNRGRVLAEIFREAHNLKGSARAVNLPEVETLAHRLETLFGLLQSGDLEARPEIVDAAYEALDAIGALVQQATTGQAANVDMPALAAKLEQAGTQRSGSAPPQSAPFTAALPASAGIARNGGVPALQTPEPSPAPAAETDGGGHPPAGDGGARPADETIRVAVSKLDALLAQIGELQVSRIAAEQQVADVRTLLDSLENGEAEWREVRQYYDRLRARLDDAARSPRDRNVLRGVPGTESFPEDMRAVLGFLEAHEARQQARRTQLTALRRSLERGSRRMAQIAADLQDDVRRVRMLPVSTVFDTFPRMVRDLTHELGKDVRLVVQGGETGLDRSVLEQVKAPLTHLIRNAIDHGIELPAVRAARGKPPKATITLTAAQRGDTIMIDVADDGAGIDIARVRASAVRTGMITTDAAEAMSEREALWLIFRSGLSTREAVSDLSGRGIGMDVVRASIERLRGLIDVDSQPGQGTRFSLHLPLTVATTECLLAQVAGHTVALPIANVLRLVSVDPMQVGRVEGRDVILNNGRPTALLRLQELLDLPTRGTPDSQRVAPSRLVAIVLGSADRRTAFMVDDLMGIQHVVVTSLPPPLIRVPYLAGATVLGTGEVGLLLNVSDLLHAGTTTQPQRSVPATQPVAARTPMILVVDDSITTRSLERSILETAGYQVRVAVDGMEAWEVIQHEGCDLVVSDVNMPRMDGFALTAMVRTHERYKHLPIILVTSLDSQEDRERASVAGADAHIAKGAFDQDTLLDTVRQLI